MKVIFDLLARFISFFPRHPHVRK
ncbi:hypothetical protein THIX_110182 [Thiomonas sp. X19]|nr:hypothetical protein THIX_110182 [Thiomonas sp. X19]